MDRVDIKILRYLQRNCRLPIAELADKVNLSTSACHRRVKLLEESKKIEGYSARLNPRNLGYRVLVYAEISLNSQSDECLNNFEQAVKICPEILECHLMSGEADYLIKVAARSTDHYERIHRRTISHLPGISKMKSNFVLRTIQGWEGYLVDRE
ncbi:MAG TPA: Lrp/AsnC family transcriptional regulator [Leucothrix mucor]|nr:Lrp/AsnC family transcriptional regulator [Leucothrix mucor]